MKLDKDKVKTIELDLTTMCNAKCPLCFRNFKNFPAKYKTVYYRSANWIIQQLKSFSNLENIYIIGQCSEPTTHSELLSMLKQFKNMHLHVKMCTNGDLHDDQYWSQIGKTLDTNDEVWFTLCGSTQEMHSRYRVNTQLKRILQHASALRSHKKIDCAKCIRFKYNQEDIESATFKKIVKRFSKVEYIDTSFDAGIEYDEKFNVDDFMPVEAVQQAYSRIDKLSDIMLNKDKKSVICQSIEENYIQIDAYGSIFPCYRYLEADPYKTWDKDYQHILDCKHNCCKLCQSDIVEYCDKNKLNSII